MKNSAKVILGLFLFALIFLLLHADDQKRQLQQTLMIPENAEVEIICGGINHGSKCALTDADLRDILKELSTIEYAPFKRSRVPYDLKKEYFYITVVSPDSSYYKRFDIFADAGYGTASSVTFSVSDEFLSLLRSLPFQT